MAFNGGAGGQILFKCFSLHFLETKVSEFWLNDKLFWSKSFLEDLIGVSGDSYANEKRGYSARDCWEISQMFWGKT